MQCIFCQKLHKNSNSLKNHQIRCKFNSNRIIIKPKERYSFYDSKEFKLKQKENAIGKTHTNATKSKLREINLNRFVNPDERLKHSKIMQQVVLNNPQSYSSNNIVGRSKHFIIDGVRYNSTWEYLVAEYLNKQNIKWIRTNIKPERYFWNDSWHLYFPDFYLLEYDCYVEVKGYETERDIAKWLQSSKKVFIIKQNEIERIKQNKFDIKEMKSKCGDHLLITD